MYIYICIYIYIYIKCSTCIYIYIYMYIYIYIYIDIYDQVDSAFVARYLRSISELLARQLGNGPGKHILVETELFVYLTYLIWGHTCTSEVRDVNG